MEGRAFKFGDNINTDIISPPQYMELSIEEASRYCMQAADPDFASEVREGDVVVAGNNFGSGSSRETSPLTLKYLGVAAVIAKSFARIFYRNAINVGILAIECEETDRIDAGDLLSIDTVNGTILNQTKEEAYTFRPIPDHIMEIIRKGGLKNMLKEQYGGKT